MKPAYRADIDGLRALAVSLVVIYHFDLFPLSGGFVGVDVFFVISGYLITLKIVSELEETSRFDFGAFYTARAKRLFPAMFVTLALSSIFAALLFTTDHLKDYGASVIHSVASISNIYFWSQSGYFDTAANLKPLLHTWSLAVEEQFYFFWPALLVLFAWLFSLRFLAALLLLLIAASLYANRIYASDPATIFFLSPFRVFELAIGAGLVTIRKLPPLPNWVKEAVVLFGLFLIVYAAVSFDETTTFPYRAALTPCLGAALVIWGGEAKWSGAFLRARPVVGIGLISYSLYLVHWPLAVFYSYYRMEEIGAVERWAMAGIAIGLATIMYFVVEQPARKTKRLSNAAYGLACAIAALVIIYPAASMWGGNGWAWRIVLPEGDLAQFVKFGGGEGAFHQINYGGAECEQPSCQFPAPGGDKFVLLGDSHARMYFAGLTKLSSDLGFSVFEGGACTFVTEVAICTGRALAGEYVASGAVDVAVLAQNWMRGNYETEFFGRPQAEWRTDPEEFADLYLELMRKLLTTGYLRNINNLVVIGEVPQFAGQADAVMCIARPSYIVSDRSCDRAQVAVHPEIQKRAEFNRLMAVGLASPDIAGRVTFIDPFAALCADGVCSQIVDGRLVYSDDDHLSKYGSEVVVEWYRNALLSVMGRL